MASHDEPLASAPQQLDDLRELARLFDEALDLDPEHRPAWLDALPARGERHARLAPRLRRMLTAQANSDPDDALARGLRLDACDDEAAQSAGQIVGGYRLLDVLGRGGMGVVWLAEPVDRGVRRLVALKLPDVAASRRALLMRFERERDILATLTHPNIARLYDAGVDADGQPWLAMEVVSGQPVTQWCDERRLDVAARLALFEQVLDAVRFAHAHLVVHRDLKPGNILVDSDGRAHLLDFGIAKLLAPQTADAPATGLTQLAGTALTPEYAAPEQFLREPASTSSDIYALGLLLHELLCGSRPYAVAGMSRAAVEALALADERERASAQASDASASARSTTRRALARRLRGDLDTIVLKAIQRDPARRYATVDALAQDLERSRRGETLLAHPAKRSERALRFVRRNSVPVALVGAVTASLAVGLGVALWQARVARVEARTAQATEAFLLSLFETTSVDRGDPRLAQQTTARQLLEDGSTRIATAMDDAPESKLRVLATLARLDRDLALDNTTNALQQQRLALFRQLHPGDSRELATAYIDAASAAIMSSDSVSKAPAELDAAEAMLAHLHEPASPLRGRLEVIRAASLDQDNCGAVKHAQLGVPMLRAGPPSDDLFDGLMVLAQNLTFCGDAEAGLRAGQEALQVTRSLGHRANIWSADEVIAQSQAAMGQLGAQIATARDGLAAVRALHAAGGTPGADELTATASLAIPLVAYGHADEALAAIGDLPERAEADIAHSDADALVSLMVPQSKALAKRGDGARATAVALRAGQMLKTFDADDSERQLVSNTLAAASLAAGDMAAARQSLDVSDVLAQKLHKVGTRANNELLSVWIRYWLLAGQPDRAEQALAGFVAKPSQSGVPTRPIIEHEIATADIALARHDAAAAHAAVQRAQQMLARRSDPEWTRDLALRAALDDTEALTASAPRSDTARAAAETALALSNTVFAPQDAMAQRPTWQVLQRQAEAAGDAAAARAWAARVAGTDSAR